MNNMQLVATKTDENNMKYDLYRNGERGCLVMTDLDSGLLAAVIGGGLREIRIKWDRSMELINKTSAKKGGAQ